MRMMMRVEFPLEKFNAAVRDGSIGAKMKKILDDLKPEAAYFTEMNGKRSGVLIFEMSDSSKLPSFAEPWFLTFDAEIRVGPAMTPEDLAKAGLDKLGKKWG